MVTALITYGSNVAASISTDSQMAITTGGTSITNTTLIGTSLNYGEIWSQGNAGAYAGSVSIGSPSDHGWLLDNTSLELQQIVAGTWTPGVKVGVSVGSIIADLHIRAFVRSASGVFTQIGSDMIFSALSITTTQTAHTFSGTSLPAQDFRTGDRLYIDFWLNITSNSTGSGAATLINTISNSGTNGTTTHVQVTTPGYQPATFVSETATGSETVTVLQVGVPVNAVSVTETATGSEIVFIQSLIETSASGQMNYADLQLQYSRIMNSLTGPLLSILAYTYYGNSTNTQVIYGELDALFSYEQISQLHALRTQNDVTAFLKAYEFASNVLSDKPIVYYRLGESAGSYAYDASGRKMTGIINGGVTLGQAGALAQSSDTAMLFDGSSGYIALPSGVMTHNWSSLSVECWIKLSNISFGSLPTVIANAVAGTSHTGFSLYLDASGAGINFVIGNGTTSANAHYVVSLAANTWYHLVGTWDGTTVTLYLNGVSHATAALSGKVGTAANPIYIGHNPASSGDFVPATLDEVALYKTALPAGRVLAHYTAGTSP